jgi:hypothetical protein
MSFIQRLRTYLSFSFTQSQGASASLVFESNAVALYTTVAPNRADIKITLDGRTTIVPGGSNGLTESLHTKTLMYYADGLDSSRHEILISSESQNENTPFVDLDSIVIFSVESPAGQSSQSGSSESSGMPTSAIIGIAVGSAVTFLLVVALGVFFCLRYRRSRRAVSTTVTQRPSSPESPIGRLPLQTPHILEAGVTQPGQVWTPPVVHREPSYHKATYKSRSRNNSISEMSLQSTSALLAVGAPRAPPFARSDSSLILDDNSRAPSFASFGDIDRGVPPLVPEEAGGAEAIGISTMSSQWDDSDSEAPPKKSLKGSLFFGKQQGSHSRSNSTTSAVPQAPEIIQPMSLPPRARSRSRSRTRDDTDLRRSGYESDGGHSNADPRAFPTKPISRPTTPTNSRPTTPTTRRPSRRGHVSSNSAESEAMDSMIRGRRDEIRKQISARSLARETSLEPAAPSQAPRPRSRSRGREHPFPADFRGAASAVTHSSSSKSLRSEYQGESGLTPRSRSTSKSRALPKQASSGTLRPEYESDADSPTPYQSRTAAAVPRHLRSAKSSVDISNDSRSRLDSGELSDINTASDSRRAKRARFELPSNDLKTTSSSSSTSTSYSTRLTPVPVKPEGQSRLQQKRHSRSGSENSFLSVDPMAAHGLPSRVPSPLGRAASLSKTRRKESPHSHSRNPSETSNVSNAQVLTRDSGLDDATRAGLAARKRSASLGRESEAAGTRRSESLSSFGFLTEQPQSRPGSAGRGRTTGRGDPASTSSKRESSVGNAF